MTETNGIVYVLTNPCLDGWVKIGMTQRDELDKRIDELNGTNIPLSFHAYAVYHVENPLAVETAAHNIIDAIDNSLRARDTSSDGKVHQKEFFRITPETAYRVLREIARARGDMDKLELCDLSDEALADAEIADAGSRRSPFRFSMVGLKLGDQIAFIKDENETAIVCDDSHVRYKGRKRTLSDLAATLMRHPSKSYPGPRFFTYEGEALSDRRSRCLAVSGPSSPNIIGGPLSRCSDAASPHRACRKKRTYVCVNRRILIQYS